MNDIDNLLEKLLHGKWPSPNDLVKWHEHIEGYSIDGCAALSESNLVFIFRKEENLPNIKLIRFYRDENTQFSGEVLDDIKIISYIVGLDNESSLWVTSAGNVFYLDKNKELSDFESDIPGIGIGSKFGYKSIKGLDKVGSNVYAAADARHVFKRIGKDDWVDITTNLDRSDIINKKGDDWNFYAKSAIGFECVGGVSENDMYAAGEDGDCWYYDGNEWSRVDLPTNEDVYKIVAINSDLLYMACSSGVLLEGSKDKWRVIKYPGNGENFYEMVKFKNTIYVSTVYHMYQLSGGELEKCLPSSQNHEIELFCYQSLSANEDIMLMCGKSSVAIFDGEFWLPFAPNGPIVE